MVDYGLKGIRGEDLINASSAVGSLVFMLCLPIAALSISAYKRPSANRIAPRSSAH